MKVVKKQRWKYDQTTIEINGQLIDIFQNTENNKWYAVNKKTLELEAYAKTKKQVIEDLKELE